MPYTPESSDSTLADVHQALLRCLHCLRERRWLDHAAQGDLDSARSLLECLPLASSQFGLACARLTNAERYLQSREFGAARYELGLLEAGLRNGERQVRQPLRRLRNRPANGAARRSYPNGRELL